MCFIYITLPPLSCSSFDSTSSVVRDSTHHATSGAHLASAWPASLAHVVRRAPRLLEAAVGEEGRPQTVVARRVRRRLVVVEL